MLHSLSETFAYDPLNRLTSTVLNGQTRTIRYNSAGSITQKSDVCTAANCFAYTGTGPHALSSITGGTVNGVANPTFTYDANGNMTAGAGRAASYTSFNMVQQATEGTTTLSLLYDPEHSRIQQTAPEGVTYYLSDPASGAMTERVFPATGSSVWRNYILADGKIVAERSVKGTNVTVRYFVLDHLGSTIALTTETGTLAETDAYDPWGKARDATTGADDTTCSKPGQAFSTRGYTGHEEMPDLCLVNMNARIYDPTIGRFMSPDDVIPDLYNGQSYNRYTYVDDNPLSYTDPTGHALANTNSSSLADMSRNPFSLLNDPSGYCIGCSTDEQVTGEPDAVSHAAPGGLTQTGMAGSGITRTTTMSVGGGQITVQGGQSPNIAGDVQGTLAYDRNSDTGKFIEENNADSGSFHYNPQMGSLTFQSQSGNGDRQDLIATPYAYASHGVIYIAHSDGTLEIRTGGTASWRDNNPGNLVYGPFTIRHGAIGMYHDVQNGGFHDFAIFETEDKGMAAFNALISGSYSNSTIAELFSHYADPAYDNVPKYIADVSSKLGVASDTRISDLTDEQRARLGPAVQSHEIWTPGTVTWGIDNIRNIP